MSKKILKNFLLVGFLFLIIIPVTIFLKSRIDIIQAREDNRKLNGWAWSSNIGWVSMNSDNCDINPKDGFIDTNTQTKGCGGDGSKKVIDSEYGVYGNISTGQFSGYAWNEMYGWIYFGPDATLLVGPDKLLLENSFISISNAPSEPKNWARYDKSTGLVTGWAKILSAKDGGWIKMSDDTNVNWKDKGVKVDLASGDLSGWAWNGDTTNIGWINFNKSSLTIKENEQVVDYKVDFPVPPVDPSDVVVGIVDEEHSCCTAKVSWNDNSVNETGFIVEKSEDQNTWNLFCSIKNPENTKTTTQETGVKLSCSSQYLNLVSGKTYSFRVRAENEKNGDTSGNVVSNNYTTSFCPPTITQESANCDGVTFTWSQNNDSGAGIKHYEVYKKKTSETNWTKKGQNIQYISDTVNRINDTEIDPGSGDKYDYKVRAVGQGQSNFKDSKTLTVNPCPKLPSWREVKPTR